MIDRDNNIIVDEESRLLRKKDGTIVYVSPMIWKIFRYMYDRQDTLITTKDIYRDVLNRNYKSHLRTNISRLREGLEGTGLYLHTAYAYGYILSTSQIETISRGKS